MSPLIEGNQRISIHGPGLNACIKPHIFIYKGGIQIKKAGGDCDFMRKAHIFIFGGPCGGCDFMCMETHFYGGVNLSIKINYPLKLIILFMAGGGLEFMKTPYIFYLWGGAGMQGGGTVIHVSKAIFFLGWGLWIYKIKF